MCGLTGCCHSSNLIFDFNKFKEISSIISHRGPDLNKNQEFESGNVKIKFGHNRLSIIDLNTSGDQPMISQNGRYAIIYNGELYNTDFIKNFLYSGDNFNLKGGSDTELLIEYFNKVPIDEFFNNIEGMFAFAIFDKKNNEIILSRDKIGEKPLYIYFNKNVFGFSSDLKPLIKLPNFNKEINRKAVNNYLKFNYISNPLTIYQNCFKLPPGTFSKINLSIFNFSSITKFDDLKNTKGIYLKKWWQLSSKKIKYNNELLAHSNEEHIESLIENSIKSQLKSDVPIGTFLSGGNDSSLITAITK